MISQVGYDDAFLSHLETRAKAENYIATAWVHLQVYYRHPFLGSQVYIERLPGMKHYKGIDLKRVKEAMVVPAKDETKEDKECELQPRVHTCTCVSTYVQACVCKQLTEIVALYVLSMSPLRITSCMQQARGTCKT